MQVDAMQASHTDRPIESAILVELSTGRLSPTELKKRVKVRIKKIPEPAWKAALDVLVNQQRLYRHYKRDKNGKPLKTIERYALDAPPPPPPPPEALARDEIVKLLQRERPSAADLKKRVRLAVPGLAVKAYDEVLKDLVVSLLSGLNRPAMPSPDVGERELVLRSLRELVDREGSGSLIAMRKLRAAAALSKERFDAVVLDLYDSDAIILHHHDHVAGLSAEERATLVVDKHGNHYVGVALRGGS